MSSTYGQEPETELLSGSGELSADYELQHILSVASAYLESGHIHDADELLQEALDADPNHPAVQGLARKLAHVKGVPEPEPVNEDVLLAAPDVLVHFTSPLPGADQLPPALQRQVGVAEQLYDSDRVYAALDLTQMLCAEHPEYIPGFVRLAEIQISLGNVAQAEELYSTLKRYYAATDEPVPWLVESLRISLNPSDTSALIAYAMTLIDEGEVTALDPFVPEAIKRALDMNPATAMDMAETYCSLKPNDVDAQRVYLHAVAASGDEARLIEAVRKLQPFPGAIDLSVLRVMADILEEHDSWFDHLEGIAVHLREHVEDVDVALEAMKMVSNESKSAQFALTRGLIFQTAERWQESLAELERSECSSHETSIARFVCSFAKALCLFHVGDPSADANMFEAAQLAYASDVEPFARTTRLFGVSAAPSDILKAFSSGDSSNPSIDALRALSDANPERVDIRFALADAYLSSGDTVSGVKELRQVAEDQENAGNLPAMIEAMRRMSQAVPSNIEIKAKLIDGYLRRGILDEAVDELDKIGALYLQRDQVADAVATFSRAAEISAALGNFERGNTLFNRAVNADPDNVPVRHAAVAFYLQTGSVNQATDQLREVVRIAIDSDDQDEAVAALHQIIALAPQDADAYHKLGEVLTSLGEYTQAERVYRRLASFTPHDPVLEAKQSALAVLAAAH